MLEQLKAICEQILRRPLAADDDLFAAGLNVNRALNIVRLFWLESGVELDVNTFIERRSLSEIASMLAEGRSGPEDKAILLQAGKGAPLFAYAGGVSVFLEIRELVQSLDYCGPVYGLRMTPFERPPGDAATVDDEVREAVAVIKSIQPEGPYRLLGYSFGGVLALEVARALESAGDEVAFCGMIDTPQNDHAWPFHLWADLMMRRGLRKLKLAFRRLVVPRSHMGAAACGDILSKDALRRLSEAGRGRHLFFRFRSPQHPNYPYFAPQWVGGNTPVYTQRGRELLRLKGLFRPRPYQGRVTFFIAAQGSPVDCDPEALWRPYLSNAEWIRMKGNHLSIVVGRNARLLAGEISRRIAAGQVAS